MMRFVWTPLLIVVVTAGNALVAHPSAIALLVALSGTTPSKQPLSMQWLDAQQPLLGVKESPPRNPHAAWGQAHWQPASLPKTVLRPFRLAIDWPLLAERLAAASLCWLEIRLQI
jgi:hypothetical protein